MFGYIKPYQPKLKLKELDAYKAVYCGLCGQLGRSFGPAARMTLSYDFTFLVMLGWAVSGSQPPVRKRRCYVNPFVKRVICESGEPLAFGADCAAILLYYKLMDNLRDDGFVKRIGWQLLRPFAALAHRKAARARPGCEALVAAQLRRQRELEEAGCASLDAAGEPMAAILAGLFRMLSEDPAQRRVLERLGYLIGRFVYLADALDDLERDMRRGGYNPLALKYELSNGDEPGSSECRRFPRLRRGKRVKTLLREAQPKIKEAREEAMASLYMTIGEAEKTRALLTLGNFSTVIDNILTMGLASVAHEIQAKKEKTR